jgi:hypothetical protein
LKAQANSAKAQRLHQEHRIEHPRRGQRRDRDQHGDEDAVVHLVCPNRPAGLISSTSAMTTKITVLEAGG